MKIIQVGNSSYIFQLSLKCFASYFKPYIIFLMQPVVKTVLVGKDNICISILIDYLNIVELSIQVRVLFVITNECSMEAGGRILPLFKFI